MSILIFFFGPSFSVDPVTFYGSNETYFSLYTIVRQVKVQLQHK